MPVPPPNRMPNTPLSLSPAKSLRARFALLMGVGGLLLGMGVAAVLAWHLESNTFDTQQHALVVASNELAGRLASDLRARRREVVLTGGLMDKTQLSAPADLRALLDKLKEEQPSYAWIGVTDATGKVVAATGQLLEGVDASARPWFAGALQGVYLGDPREAKLLATHMPRAADNEPVRFVDVAVPLHDSSGAVRGVLSAHLHWSWVKDVIAHVAQEQGSLFRMQFIIADRNGQVLLAPPGEAAKSLDQLDAENQASGAFLARRSAPELSQASEFGWSVMARESMADVMAPIHRVRAAMLLLAVALGGAIVWLTWAASKVMVRPIVEFADEASRFVPDGSTPFNPSAASRTDEVGTLARTMGALVEKLRIHADRNQLFFEHAPVSLAVFDPQMRYLMVSRRWLEDYGLQGRQLLGQSHYDVLPEIPPHWRELHQRGLAGEVVASQGESFARADGQRQWVRWEMRPWQLPDGSTGGIAIFSEDITARTEAERALQVSENRLRLATEAAGIGIFDWDIRQQSILWTPQLEAIYGHTPSREGGSYAY